MKLCVLYSGDEEETTIAAKDYVADLGGYLPEHLFEYHFIAKSTAGEQIEKLVSTGYDVFINLCDGAATDTAAGIEVVETLEQLNQAFTGAASDFYDATRARMKQICREHGIPTPAYLFANDLETAERAAHDLRYPLIVKHHNSYSSIGLTPASRVQNRAELRTEAQRLLDDCGSVLIEEFVEGHEFICLVVENPGDRNRPHVMRPLQVNLPADESFLHYDLKDNHRESLSWTPLTDDKLSARISEQSRALFVGLNGSSYGRCDLRMNRDGELFMLEINQNCGIFYPEDSPFYPTSADAILSSDPIGPRGFLERIIDAALRRRALRAA